MSYSLNSVLTTAPSLVRNLMNTSLVLDDAICTFMQINFKRLELTQIHRFQWTTCYHTIVFRTYLDVS